jgi:hypothetical protein
VKRLRNRQLTRNRVLLLIVGAILVGVGIAGLLLTSDTVDRITDWADRRQPLLNADLDDAIADNELAFQLAALAFAIVCILLGLWWLRSQIPPMRHHQDNVLTNQVGEVEGRNIIGGRALASAMADDLEHHPAVEQARVELRPEDQLIRIRVSAADAFPIDELARTVIAPATERAVRVGELPGDLEVLTDVRLVPESRRIA